MGKLDGQGHAARGLWNLLHEWHIMCREHRRSALPLAAVDRQMREARKSPPEGFEWLSLLPAQACQQVLKQYQAAWKRCYAGLARPPRFRFRRRARLAVDVPQASGLQVIRRSRRWGVLSVPGVGRVRFRWTRPLPGVSRGVPGRLTGARLVREVNGWHVVFRIETPDVRPEPHGGPVVGVDRGVTRTLALSDGSFRDLPVLLSVGEAGRLLRLERKAARQRRARARGAATSNRLTRTYDQIARVRARTKRRRDDWAHKVTTGISREFGLVVIEDLRVGNMTRSARGAVENPGRQVRQKAGLNRSVLNAAWGRIGAHLAYKTAWEGGVLVKVPAPYTSQRCHVCGVVDRASRPDQATFLCTSCGWSGNADINASLNIRAAGLSSMDVEISGLPGTVKRQPSGEAA
ncbi:transposase [Frankia torreyi]|uniref:Transposase n=1 Tax=Frankia torreyi TaxID=1856 RepID=A0A0D8BKY5_9ACTN|nr:transposase [Frankia torreyi]